MSIADAPEDTEKRDDKDLPLRDDIRLLGRRGAGRWRRPAEVVARSAHGAFHSYVRYPAQPHTHRVHLHAGPGGRHIGPARLRRLQGLTDAGGHAVPAANHAVDLATY